ncbi:MAG: thioesterase family protein [Magnetovibrio sp.]|nr:thioesterase family protein [Magnetovibrio sp.]
MKDTLKPGIRYTHTYTVPDNKTVPALYPDAPELQEMPEVFATGFMVGFMEWACIKAIEPHLNWPEEMTVGTHVNLSHEAATPPGMTVKADVELIKVDGKRLVFTVEGHDGEDIIGRGTHERFIINRDKFSAKVKEKGLRARS